MSDAALITLSSVWGLAGVSMLGIRREPVGVLALAAGGVGFAGLAIDGAGLLALGGVVGIGMALTMGLPDGRLRSTTARATAIAGAVIAIGVGALLRAADASAWPMLGVGALGFVVAMSVSVARYRRARGLERQRMQWFGWGGTIGAVVAIVAVSMRVLLGWPDDGLWVTAVASGFVPLALVIASVDRFTKHIDRILEATVSIAGLVGLVAVIYLVVIIGLGEFPDESERTLIALSMLAALIAALAFPATRARLADVAARIVYGEQHAPDEVLRTFGSRMSREVPMDELLLQAAESLRKTFGVDSVEIWTGQAGQLERTVSLPERGPARLQIGVKELPVLVRAGVTGPAWLKVWLPALLKGREDSMVRVAPVAHQGDLLGMIVVENHDATDELSGDGEQVLVDLARTVGVALHNVQLDSALQRTLDDVRRQAEELRASRARIVKAADAARSKLQADLHDGAQQHVVALAVKAKLIKTVLDSDVEMAKSMLDEMGTDIQEAVQQLRDFVHGVYPPVLRQFGLSAALEAAAGKSALATDVKADDIGRYPEDIEAAVYFCCLEAMQNAAKHAGETARTTISLRESEGVLLFEVADDGAGFDQNGQGLGKGFVNMADRIGAAGGTLDVTSALGRGTTVSGRIPVG